MKKLVLTVLLALAALPIFAEESYSVVSDSLNVRKGPGTNYDVLGRVYKDESVEVIETSGDWSRIIFEGSYGYVCLYF
jgi:N-acetylmuramoyl-L-alanine amidase